MSNGTSAVEPLLEPRDVLPPREMLSPISVVWVGMRRSPCGDKPPDLRGPLMDDLRSTDREDCGSTKSVVSRLTQYTKLLYSHVNLAVCSDDVRFRHVHDTRGVRQSKTTVSGACLEQKLAHSNSLHQQRQNINRSTAGIVVWRLGFCRTGCHSCKAHNIKSSQFGQLFRQ